MLVVIGLPRSALADSCTHPDLLETIPPDKATAVPTNAILFARYEANAQYINEQIGFDQIHAGMLVSSVDLSTAMCGPSRKPRPRR